MLDRLLWSLVYHMLQNFRMELLRGHGQTVRVNTRITHWSMDEKNLARLAEEEVVLIAEHFDVAARSAPIPL